MGGDALRLTAGTRWERASDEPAPTSDDARPSGSAAAAQVASTPAPTSSASVSTGAGSAITLAPAASATPSPNDASAAEDAAYLRIIALLHEGREAEAKAAARDYLRRFPEGFRSVEAAKIAE
jgi:hypothetical protein